MTTTTIIIKRDADRNYDRLFARLESGSMFGRVASVSERETPAGYAVELAYLDDETRAWLDERSKDFELA